MKKLATLAIALSLSSVAVYDQLKPVTVDDAVKEIEWENRQECGQKEEEDYITICDGEKMHLITAKEVKELGNVTEVEERIYKITGQKQKLDFDFKEGRFIKETGGMNQVQ